MTDRIDKLVEHAIGYTSEMLAADGKFWSVAERGLDKMLENLRIADAGHPALARLAAFIAAQNEVYGGGGARH